MIEVELTRGLVALISSEDQERVLQYKWYAHASSKGRFYAARKDSEGKMLYMHRFIMEAPTGTVIDHINGNRLDNRRSNLRITNHSLNALNRVREASGVTYFARTGRWRAAIRVEGRDISLGIYDTKEQAQRVVSLARKEIIEMPDIRRKSLTTQNAPRHWRLSAVDVAQFSAQNLLTCQTAEEKM